MSAIRVGAVQLWSDFDRTPEANREHAFEMAREAIKDKLDLLVLPESISMLCYPDGRPNFSYHDVAEPVPGRSTEILSQIAKDGQTNLIAGLIESRGSSGCQNLAVVFNRKGQLVGRYEKVHEPEVCRLEQAAEVGNSIPVFHLDIGVVGIMICWDLISPEIASILAHKGAQIICFPHMIGLPSTANFEIQLRARAIDTGLPIVAAGMRDNGSHSGDQDGFQATTILNADGEVVAAADGLTAQVIVTDLDLTNASPNSDRVEQMRRDLRFEIYATEYAQLNANRLE